MNKRASNSHNISTNCLETQQQPKKTHPWLDYLRPRSHETFNVGESLQTHLIKYVHHVTCPILRWPLQIYKSKSENGCPHQLVYMNKFTECYYLGSKRVHVLIMNYISHITHHNVTTFRRTRLFRWSLFSILLLSIS